MKITKKIENLLERITKIKPENYVTLGNVCGSASCHTCGALRRNEHGDMHSLYLLQFWSEEELKEETRFRLDFSKKIIKHQDENRQVEFEPFCEGTKPEKLRVCEECIDCFIALIKENVKLAGKKLISHNTDFYLFNVEEKEQSGVLKKAEELRKIAEEVKKAKEVKDEENTKYATKHFLSMAENNAKNGRFEKSTSCLLKKKNSYHCQTENDGNGFEIKHLEDVIKNLEDMGFKIDFKSKENGYCPLKISW